MYTPWQINFVYPIKFHWFLKWHYKRELFLKKKEKTLLLKNLHITYKTVSNLN